MLLLRCSALLTGCFTRYLSCHCQLQHFLNEVSIFVLIHFVTHHQDWWNSTSFANYYRTWNVVVHDWLYYYVYRDFLWVSSFAISGFHLLFSNDIINYKFTMILNTFFKLLLMTRLKLCATVFWFVCSLCRCHSRSLRSVSDQPPCCLFLRCPQWSTSTFLQSVLVSSTPCSSASSCVLEVRKKSSLTILTPKFS